MRTATTLQALCPSPPQPFPHQLRPAQRLSPRLHGGQASGPSPSQEPLPGLRESLSVCWVVLYNTQKKDLDSFSEREAPRTISASVHIVPSLVSGHQTYWLPLLVEHTLQSPFLGAFAQHSLPSSPPWLPSTPPAHIPVTLGPHTGQLSLSWKGSEKAKTPFVV